MSYEEVIFYPVAVVTVVGALGVVTARNIVHSALFLILALIAVAGVFILMAADFLAVVQVLIYGGAVTILILFAMMLTRARDVPEEPDGPQKPFAALTALAFMATSIVAIVSTKFPGENDKINVITIDKIGDALFRTWAVPFEVASLLLTVALLGAIILARGEEGE
jgi:NADH-quinone oxidoreductase subunit J